MNKKRNLNEKYGASKVKKCIETECGYFQLNFGFSLVQKEVVITVNFISGKCATESEITQMASI